MALKHLLNNEDSAGHFAQSAEFHWEQPDFPGNSINISEAREDVTDVDTLTPAPSDSAWTQYVGELFDTQTLDGVITKQYRENDLDIGSLGYIHDQLDPWAEKDVWNYKSSKLESDCAAAHVCYGTVSDF